MSRAPVVGVPLLIDGIAFGGLIANKAFDSNAIIADLDERQAAAIISRSTHGASAHAGSTSPSMRGGT